jgi:hypothetical protein
MPKPRVASQEIISRLLATDAPGLTEEHLLSLTKNDLVRLGHAKGVLTEEQLHASLDIKHTVVKSYLWTFLDDPDHRSRVREYAILCSKVQQRAYLTLKTAYFACASGLLGDANTAEVFAKGAARDAGQRLRPARAT